MYAECTTECTSLQLRVNLTDALLFLCNLQQCGHDRPSHINQRCHASSWKNGVPSTVRCLHRSVTLNYAITFLFHILN